MEDAETTWTCPACSHRLEAGQAAGEAICGGCGQLLWLEAGIPAATAKRIKITWDTIDMNNALALQEMLTDASRSVDRLLVDISAVELLASQGLATLLTLQQSMRPQGRAIVLREPRPFVRKMLGAVGFAPMFGL